MTTRAARRLRFTAWVVLCAAVVLGHIVWLFRISGRKIFYVVRSPFNGETLIALALLGIWFLLKTAPADAIRLSTRTSRFLIIMVAVLLQAAAIALLLPALNEDLVRNRLDARTWLSGVSPYSVSPAEMRQRALTRPKYAPDGVDSLVTAPEVHTTRGPVAEAAFVLAGWAERSLRHSPTTADPAPATWPSALMRRDWTYHALAFRALAALSAVGCCLVLLRLLRVAGASPWWAVLFAWNPLTTLEAGGMGHVDFLGVLLLLAALLAARQSKNIAAMVCLALAAGVSLVAIAAAPPMIWHLRTGAGRRAAWSAAITFLAAIVALYVPILLYHKGYAGWFDGWRTLLAASNAGTLSILIRGLVLATAGVVAWRYRRAGLVPGAYGLVMAALLIVPTTSHVLGAWLICFVPLLLDRTPAGFAGIAWSAAPWSEVARYAIVAPIAVAEWIVIGWERRRSQTATAQPQRSGAQTQSAG